MRFFNNGTLLYALNTTHPKDMTRNLKLGLPEEKKIFLGYYDLVGRRLTVRVALHYCTMHFGKPQCYELMVSYHSLLTCCIKYCSRFGYKRCPRRSIDWLGR